MNWLAHLYLSEPNAEFRVGNLLPDLTSAARLAHLPEPYQKGIRCHRQIDAFTDSHPRMQSCVRRFPPPYRRFGGILTDVYFDYLLARDWAEYSVVRLPDFISEIYRDIETCSSVIPAEANLPLQRMREEDWLGRYHHTAGVADILGRIGRRLRRPFDLAGSLPIFQQHQSSFLEDFQAFFPELKAHLQVQPAE
jgi:acyl carrier protein phosphodiesterase